MLSNLAFVVVLHPTKIIKEESNERFFFGATSSCKKNRVLKKVKSSPLAEVSHDETIRERPLLAGNFGQLLGKSRATCEKH